MRAGEEIPVTKLSHRMSGDSERRARRVIVIGITCIVGVLLIWPAADDYCGACRQRRDLTKTLTRVQDQVANVDSLEAEAAQVARDLATLKAAAVPVEATHAFRDELIELTRGAGCQIREIDLRESQRRKWLHDDHPLRTAHTADDFGATPYDLTTQQVSATAAGTFGDLRKLLGQLRARQKLLRVDELDLRPTGEANGRVRLLLELTAYDLQQRPDDPAELEFFAGDDDTPPDPPPRN